MSIQSINPSTEEFIQEYKFHTPAEIDEFLERAYTTFIHNRKRGIGERIRCIETVGALLRKQRDELAALMTLEMGKPILQARAEIEKCAWVCDYYAENGRKLLNGRRIKTDAGESFVRYDPIGVVLAVMPWNFPFWQVFRAAVPALVAGNCIILKHASNVPACGIAIEDLFTEGGFSPGHFTNLLISSETVRDLIQDSRIAAVTLTGSETAGKSVASIAGLSIKKSLLELGGSDPFVILADANLDEAAKAAARARTQNSGQSCIAAKRLIVEQEVCELFTEKLYHEMERLNVGDPVDESTDVGPLARRDLRETLHSQVTQSIKQGANLIVGGEIPDRRGFYYPPTILNRVTPMMTASVEETFGPVAVIVEAKNKSQAIELANASLYGLGASVWTENKKQMKRIAAQIEAGAVFFNGMVKSDPRLPFGGIKLSGYGRELSAEGIREFTNAKTVWIK